jgi:hypothetical protein
MTAGSPGETLLARIPRPTTTGVIAMALAVAFAVWLAVRDGEGSRTAASSPTPAETAPAATEAPASTLLPATAFTQAGLETRVHELGQPVYWAGPRAGYRYELKRTEGGNVFLRYLAPGGEVDDGTLALTIGTYPMADALAATEQWARTNDAVALDAPGKGRAFYRLERPTNLYLVYPGFDYQIEVYDPSAKRARELILLGQIRRIE